MVDDEFDYVIVGAGSAGCVLARRLGDGSDERILLLESGGPYTRGLDVPLASLWLWNRLSTRYTWGHLTTPQEHVDGRRLPWPTGKLVGGSSSINAMMYLRGHPACFDRWASLGNRGWSFAECLPYFRKSECYEGGASTYHGASGPMGVSEPRYRPPTTEAFIAGCTEAGLSLTPDFNGAIPEGAGFFQVTQRRGLRVSTAKAFLRPVLASGRITLRTQANVVRVLLESGKARGVEYLERGELRRVRAAREVILSAGTLHSPAILMRSGVGPAEHLASLGLPAIVDLPGVGSNLQDHPAFPVVFASRAPRPDRLTSLPLAGLQYVALRTGLLSSNLCEAGAVLRSTAGLELPDIQIVFHWKGLAPDPPEAVDLRIVLLTPQSSGSIRLRSADPLAPPNVDPRYLENGADLQAAERGVELCRNIGRTRAFRSIGLGPEIVPGEGLAGELLREKLRQRLSTSYHPVGTCRMGTGPDSVVDDRLRVHGIDGLRVVDASIIPDTLTANTNAATVMIGERAADFVLGHRLMPADPEPRG
jgi:choline dehydrogenase